MKKTTLDKSIPLPIHQRLPKEIWEKIASSLFPSDVKSLQLTCKYLRQMTFDYMVSLTARNFDPLPITLVLKVNPPFHYPTQKERITLTKETPSLVHSILPLSNQSYVTLVNKNVQKMTYTKDPETHCITPLSKEVLFDHVDDLTPFFVSHSYNEQDIPYLMRKGRDVYLATHPEKENFTLPNPLTLPCDVKSTHKLVIELNNETGNYAPPSYNASAIAFLLKNGQLIFAKDNDLSQFHPPIHPTLAEKKFKRAWSDSTGMQLALLGQDGYLYLWKTHDTISSIKHTLVRFWDTIQLILFKDGLLVSSKNRPHRLFVDTALGQDEHLVEQDSFFEGETDFHNSNLYLMKDNAGCSKKGAPPFNPTGSLTRLIEILAVSRDNLHKKTMLYFHSYVLYSATGQHLLRLSDEKLQSEFLKDQPMLKQKYEKLEQQETPFTADLKKKLAKNPPKVDEDKKLSLGMRYCKNNIF